MKGVAFEADRDGRGKVSMLRKAEDDCVPFNKSTEEGFIKEARVEVAHQFIFCKVLFIQQT